jgi:hypothetical protein
MRKLVFLLAFIVASPATLGALVSKASAQTSCPDFKIYSTKEKLENKLKEYTKSCESNCDDTKNMKNHESIPGCKASCGSTVETCKKRFDTQAGDTKAADDAAKRAAEALAAKRAAADKAAVKANDGKTSGKKEYSFHEKMACRKPLLDCAQKCPAETHAWVKCNDACEKQFGAAYEACQKETGPLVDSKK